jgi:hypothetical protein
MKQRLLGISHFIQNNTMMSPENLRNSLLRKLGFISKEIKGYYYPKILLKLG